MCFLHVHIATSSLNPFSSWVKIPVRDVYTGITTVPIMGRFSPYQDTKQHHWEKKNTLLLVKYVNHYKSVNIDIHCLVKVKGISLSLSFGPLLYMNPLDMDGFSGIPGRFELGVSILPVSSLMGSQKRSYKSSFQTMKHNIPTKISTMLRFGYASYMG